MSSAAERKFINIRKRLDQLGYRQPLSVECLPLVEKLFSDLVHTTESLRSTKLSASKAEKENANCDFILEPYKTENARLVRENNDLHLELLKLKEKSDQHVKDLKITLRKIEHETADLKFLNNQYIHKVKQLEKDSKAKTEKIQQLQEKNLHAVVQTPGGKKRPIAFRRQRMHIDQPVPPSGLSAYPIPQPSDPYVADLLQVADNRIHELQQEVSQLQEKLAASENGAKHYEKQIELREREIERLATALDGGRSHDVLSLESRNKSNEKLIAHLNHQVDFLQQTNRDLEDRIQDLLDSKHTVTNEVVSLSNKNEELCQELSEIDHLAQQMERHKEIALETADKELGEAKKEIKRKHSEIQDLEEAVARLKSELCSCQREQERLADELLIVTDEKSNLESVLNQIEDEKHRLSEKVEKLMITEGEIVLELEKMRLEYGVLHANKTPSRLDSFVKSLEEDRDHYKMELEHLQKTVRRRAVRERSPFRKSPEKSDYNSELRLVTRERDELQAMMDRFEKHVVEIQSNVKLLTAERDKLNDLYEQAQDELSVLRRDAVSQDVLCRLEEEKENALTDLRRLIKEKECLREKLKNQQDLTILGKSELEYKIEELKNTNYELETERFDLKSKVSQMRETIASLEGELKVQSQKRAQASEDSSQQQTELNSLRLLNDQLQRSLDDFQHRLSVKRDKLQSAQAQIAALEDRIDTFNRKITCQDEEVNTLKRAVCVLDREKDHLQETVDEKTERLACLDDNLANKEKAIAHLKLTLTELESAADRLKDTLSNRDREVASLHRQLDTVHLELGEQERSKEVAVKEIRRLQDDLATMTRENQAITAELEAAVREKEEMKSRVHNYITEVSRFESLIATKEQENRDLLDKFQMLHSQAEDWEVKAHHAEGESSSIRLELLSVDTDRRHLRERVEFLEKEIQEHMSAHQAYESQISSAAKAKARLEEELRREKDEKSSALADLSSVRELCIKLDSSKEVVARQFASKNIEFERVLAELDDARTESELLKKQLSSERLSVKNLETLLATNRDKEFHNHLTSHEKDSEIQLLKDKLTLSESKLTSHNRETAMLRTKVAQLQTDYDVLKRQLTTERFERDGVFKEQGSWIFDMTKNELIGKYLFLKIMKVDTNSTSCLSFPQISDCVLFTFQNSYMHVPWQKPLGVVVEWRISPAPFAVICLQRAHYHSRRGALKSLNFYWPRQA
ncbi:centrosomal protein of 135 kDa isoform X2 [Ornithorhynchus anatinus]|uniref:centrosomal protein of 135 kDa isoform X2 n=1 Tax=Ornithorhynchus anatinus TaxID=9258 RepID=UPI0010A8BE55|nr:centrosomal protein of 135 kDa isoform X2 [Ornithorhynchus anatinus]